MTWDKSAVGVKDKALSLFEIIIWIFLDLYAKHLRTRRSSPSELLGGKQDEKEGKGFHLQSVVLAAFWMILMEDGKYNQSGNGFYSAWTSGIAGTLHIWGSCHPLWYFILCCMEPPTHNGKQRAWGQLHLIHRWKAWHQEVGWQCLGDVLAPQPTEWLDFEPIWSRGEWKVSSHKTLLITDNMVMFLLQAILCIL